MRHFLLFDAGSKGDTGTFALSAGPPIAIPVDPLVLVRAF
jgi:hypothetical protein